MSMYKKLLKIFVSKNINNFLIIIFCISLSLSGFLISENLTLNVQKLIANEAKPILWWDIKLDTDSPLSDNQKQVLEALQNDGKIIISEKIQTYTTIVDKSWDPSVVSLLFVDVNYPLYWDFQVNKISNGNINISQNVADLFVRNGEIEVYGQVYKVGWIITKIPETWVNFYDDWKKIVLPKEEFNRLGIEQVGARLDREYLLKVTSENDFKTILEDLKENPLFSSVRIRDYINGWDRFSDTFAELDMFIKYVLIISFLLTVFIIFLSVEAFYIWNKKVFSILKILGIKNNTLILFNTLLFSSIFIISLLISFVLSWICFQFIDNFDLTKDFYLHAETYYEVVILWGIILFVSLFLPIYKFVSSHPLSWLKENFLQIYTKKELIIQFFLISLWSIWIYILVVWSLGEALVFTLWLITLFFVFLFFIKKLFFLLYKKLSFIKNNYFDIYDSIRNTIKPWNLTFLIFFSFFISFASLLFITIVSLNFLSRLNLDLEPDNNIYVINLKEEDYKKLPQDLMDTTYSVILARILTINGNDIKTHLGEMWESRRFTREFNITDNPLTDVNILEWEKVKPWQVSVDDDFAESLSVDIWDEIEFFVYGLKRKLKVVNIRESQVSWARPFFYFQVDPVDFKDFPKTYFLSTFVEETNMKDFKNDILNKTGNYVSFIEVWEIIKEIKSISEKILIIVQILFIYIFSFCIISIFIAIIFLIPFKKKKTKLYSILWARTKFLERNNKFEYMYIELITLVISILVSSVWAYFLLNQSNFISFEFKNYFLSLLILLTVSTILIFIINSYILRILRSNKNDILKIR